MVEAYAPAHALLARASALLACAKSINMRHVLPPRMHKLLSPQLSARPPTAVNVLKAVQGCPTVCRIYCATANPTAVVIGKDGGERRGILGERCRTACCRSSVLQSRNWAALAACCPSLRLLRRNDRGPCCRPSPPNRIQNKLLASRCAGWLLPAGCGE